MHDWYDIQQQIEHYATRLVELTTLRQKAMDESVAILNGELSIHWERWKEAALHSTHHLVPDFDEAPNTVYPVPKDLPPAVILSSDGSQIFPNRHEITSLAMITVSRICIDYHNYREMPLMDSQAKVFLQEDFDPIRGTDREISFEDLISDRRTLDELEILASLAETQREKIIKENSSLPILALSDGSLILWRLAERFEQAYESRIIQQYLETLNRFQKGSIPVAGYISSTNNREVINLIRIVQESSESTAHSPIAQEPGLTDRILFSRILKKRTRSTLFHSQSKIVREKYSDHRISYFYLHGGEEIAKIEIPRWIAEEPTLVDLVAGYCYQQVQLGGGYPTVLSEAHEHAVVRGPDRETFYMLVEETLRRQGMDPSLSAKQFRKRVPMM